MSLTRHEDPDAFLAAAAPMLARNAAVAAGFRAWASALARAPRDERRFMATFGGEVEGVAFQRGDGPVALGESSPEASAAFAAALAGEHPALAGVTGDDRACQAFAREWRMRTGRAHRLRFRLRDHVLGTLAMPRAVPGKGRVADEADREWLMHMQRAFASEARVPLSDESLARQVDVRLAERSYRIWWEGERVAFAGYSDAGTSAVRIGPVYTCPSQRRRGYASALVASLAAEHSRAGRDVFLITDLANPTSNALYARIGFVPLGEACAYDLVEPE